MVAAALRSSAWTEWGTPSKIFGPFNDEFGPFTLDVCASPWNAKCDRFFTKDQNGLKQQWTGRMWCNPPYGRGVGEWLGSAWASCVHKHAELVCVLVPSRTDTKWWHTWAVKAAEMRWLYGRYRFLREDGSVTNRCPFPVVALIYRARS